MAESDISRIAEELLEQAGGREAISEAVAEDAGPSELGLMRCESFDTKHSMRRVELSTSTKITAALITSFFAVASPLITLIMKQHIDIEPRCRSQLDAAELS